MSNDAIISFQLQRALSTAGPWKTVDVKDGETLSDLDPGLTAGVTYYYRVRGRNVGGYGLFSNIVEVTPTPPLEDPIPALSPWFYLRDDQAGSTPGQWDDISGNARHWTTAPSCNFPTLTADGFDFPAGDGSVDTLTGIVGPDLTGLNGTSTPRTMIIYFQSKNTDTAGILNFGTSATGLEPLIFDGASNNVWLTTFSRPNRGTVVGFTGNTAVPFVHGSNAVFKGGNSTGSSMGAGAEGLYIYQAGNTTGFPSDPIIGHNNDAGGLSLSIGANAYIRAVAFFDYQLTESQYVECGDYWHQLYGTINYYYISQMLEVTTASPVYDPGTFHGFNPGGTINGGTRSVLNGMNMVTNGTYLWSGSQGLALTKDYWNGAIFCAHGNFTDSGMLSILSSFNGDDISYGWRKQAVGGGVQHQFITGTYASYETYDVGPVVNDTSDTLYHLGFSLDFAESTNGTLRLYFNSALDSTTDLPVAAGAGLTMVQLLGMRSKTGETPTSRVGQIFHGFSTALWPDWMFESLYNGGDGRPNNDKVWYG